MKNLLDSIINALDSGQPVALVGVIASSGSTPRGAGALMAVFADGRTAGTIGGGAVEYEAAGQAMKLFDTKESRIASYSLSRNDVADLGMICGGDVTVFYEYLDFEDSRCRDLYSYARSALDRNDNAWLVRRFEGGMPVETAVYDSGGLRFASATTEEDVKQFFGSAPILTGGEVQYYVEPLVRAGRVFVFGGGHVAQELVPALARVGFSVVVYEDREEFAKKELFPDAADVILHDFGKIYEKVALSSADYVVIMTRGHQKDFEVLDQTLRTPARYVGCIGSSKKLAATKQRLADASVPESAFENLYCPIGLQIKAETPAEIAVSVAAEMILFRAEHN
ncbi:MAG: XdhC family protein [Oscillospiraceae bacterium]|nr:XdhC family protein [Oscillospiraceae bacterium]